MPPARARLELIQRAAALVVDAFDDYNARFSDVTRRARRNFLRRDWARQQIDAQSRMVLYDACVAETIGRLEALLTGARSDGRCCHRSSMPHRQRL